MVARIKQTINGCHKLLVERRRGEIKHKMATDLESLRVTIKEIEREIRRGGAQFFFCTSLQSKCISSEACGRERIVSPSIKYICSADTYCETRPSVAVIKRPPATWRY